MLRNTMAKKKNLLVAYPFATCTTLWSIVLGLTCCLGDWLCQAVSHSDLLWRVLADNLTHGAIGMVSWAVVILPGRSVTDWMQCVLCGFAASVIDLDHFLQARSLRLKDAVTLQQRPPFHATTLVFLVSGLLWVISLALQAPQLKKLALLCCVAWLTHHLRDASRRGLWFPPVGSTPPLPYPVYVISTVLVALLARCVYVWCVALPREHTLVFEAGSMSVVMVE